MFYNLSLFYLLFTACLYHFLFWRYLNSSMTSFLSDILLPFPNLNNLKSCRLGVIVAHLSRIGPGHGNKSRPYLQIQEQCAISESAQPHSFLNGVYGKCSSWTLWNPYEKIAFCTAVGHVSSKSVHTFYTKYAM